MIIFYYIETLKSEKICYFFHVKESVFELGFNYAQN